MKCPNCGNELSDGTRFCTHCGRPVNRQQSPNQNPNWNSKLATPISNGGLTLTPPGYSTGIR